MPAITGLIIDKAKKRPGPGFFLLYEQDENDPEFCAWWKAQIRAAKNYDWSHFIGKS
jgi:hypothetical protein